MPKEPGEFPFTRGLYKNMYKSRLWTSRQYAGYTSAKKSNERFKYLLNNGVKGLSVAFDLPTQIGYDSDNTISKGEVGRVGVPIAIINDMETLLKDIPIDEVSISMTINSTAAILLAFYIVVAEKRGYKINSLMGTLQNDILKEYIARGTYIFPADESLRLTTDLIEYCNNYLPRWNPISISGYHIREAGSSLEQELAFTFSNAIEYVRSLIKRGLDPNIFGLRLSFFFNSHNGFLEEVSKFRAARAIWATIMKDWFKVKNKKAMMCRFHIQTGGSTLTSKQPMNNTIRTSMQALAAIFGGAQSLHTNGWDEAMSLPSKSSAKLALRTQQIIAHESNITNYPDPFGGSYVVEELTNKIIKNTFYIINQIEEIGGAAKAIDNGWIQNEISKSASEIQKNIDNKKNIIIGVNKFEDKDEIKENPFKIDLKTVQKQIENLKSIKMKRDLDKVYSALKRLKKTAKSSKNLMPSIINCAKNECSTGEISDVLREVFGEY